MLVQELNPQHPRFRCASDWQQVRCGEGSSTCYHPEVSVCCNDGSIVEIGTPCQSVSGLDWRMGMQHDRLECKRMIWATYVRAARRVRGYISWQPPGSGSTVVWNAIIHRRSAWRVFCVVLVTAVDRLIFAVAVAPRLFTMRRTARSHTRTQHHRKGKSCVCGFSLPKGARRVSISRASACTSMCHCLLMYTQWTSRHVMGPFSFVRGKQECILLFYAGTSASPSPAITVSSSKWPPSPRAFLCTIDGWSSLKWNCMDRCGQSRARSDLLRFRSPSPMNAQSLLSA